MRDLQSRLQEARATETMLPTQGDELQARLQREFSQLQSREAGVSMDPGCGKPASPARCRCAADDSISCTRFSCAAAIQSPW